MSKQAIGVVGAGTMGQGIAQVALTAGREVRLYDVAEAPLARAQAEIEKGLTKLGDKGKLTAEAGDAALARLAPTTSLEALADCEVILEAAPERPDLKESLFRDLSRLSPEAILASNTSSLSLTRLAAVSERPERVVGMHFFNPVPVLGLVEVIRAEQTADATVAKIEALAEELGKTAVAIADSPGFAVNRLLVPMINEAVYTLYEGVGSVKSIDESMKLGANHPMGPLELADFIGMDTCLAIMNVLHDGLADTKYRPCPRLTKYVEAGWLGRKTGRGFYDYRGETPVPTR